MIGNLSLTFEVTNSTLNGDFVSSVNYHVTLPEDSSLDTVKEYCVDGIRALGYTFPDGDFL